MKFVVLFFTMAVRDAVAQQRFANERSIYGLEQDTDYVSGLLIHSVLFGFENPFGIWGYSLTPKSEIEEIEGKLMRRTLSDEAAQDVADKILLMFGLFHPRTAFLPREATWLKNFGGELYARAAQIHQPPLREQLESMAGSVLPWAEVLKDLKRRECLLVKP